MPGWTKKLWPTVALGCALGGTVGCSHQNAEMASAPAKQPAAAAAPSPAPAPAPEKRHTYAQLNLVDAAPLNTQLTGDQLSAECQKLEQDADAKLSQIVAVKDGERTFEKSFLAYEQAMTDYSDAATRLAFLKEIHPEKSVRDAAAACEEREGKYFVKVGARKDLYQAMKSYLTQQQDGASLDAEDRRLIEITMRDFRRNGLELSDADREELVKVRSKLAELATRFGSNLDEDNTTFEVTAAELKGMPKDFISRLKKAPDGKLILTTKYPDYYPVMENAKLEATRKKMELAFDNRESEKNLPLLAEAVALRDRAAHLLKFQTHADYVTEDRMAKDAKTVHEFLARLQTELKPGRDALDAKMLALKVAETHDKKAKLQIWDWRYYLNQVKQKQYALDDEQVRSYFPADKVLSGMFQVYSKLFGVDFVEVPNAQVWADGVKLYEIRNGNESSDGASDGKPAGAVLAKFYIDLFPRPGKYGHAASFPLGLAREVKSQSGAGYQIPLSALVVNFNPPSDGKVAHLNVQEVETLFHEFGHIVHQSLTTARYSSLGGTNVATDFVEAPSQMLENWVYQPEVLKLITEDPKDPSKTMPEELAKKIVAARTYDAGVRYTRQVYLATFDQTLHTTGDKVDPDQVEQKLRLEIMGYPVPHEEHSAASFGHLMNGYDAGYYGYLWSQVFAEDMFTRFENEGVLNPKVGHQYRDIILAKGRTVEPDVLLSQFLGRAPNEHAFLRLMGIEPVNATKK